MTEEKLPRDVPLDPSVPEPLRGEYVGVKTAIEVTGASKATINRHVRNGTLAGLRMGERMWYVNRCTEEHAYPPGLTPCTLGRPGS